MIKNFNEAKNMQIMFFKYFQSSLSPILIIFSIYVLICAVSIFKYSLKNIILTVLGFLIVYLGYLLVYDVTYINYLISLRLDEVFRVLVAQYLPYFTLSKYAPSKALPKLNKSHLNVIRILFDNSFIMRYYFEFLLQEQKRLLYIGRIFIIILNLPESKKIIKSKKTYIKDYRKLFLLIKIKSELSYR
jgi:hypothetical protein